MFDTFRIIKLSPNDQRLTVFKFTNTFVLQEELKIFDKGGGWLVGYLFDHPTFYTNIKLEKQFQKSQSSISLYITNKNANVIGTFRNRNEACYVY